VRRPHDVWIRSRLSPRILSVRTEALAAWLAVALGAWALGGCGGAQDGELPVSMVPPLSAQVGREVRVPLYAPAGSEPVLWSWDTPNLPELPKRPRRPTLTTYTLGRAVWRFTPLAEDFGEHDVVFSAQSGARSGSATLRLVIGAGSAPPVFREPVGEGTTLDLRLGPCTTISVVVESSADRDVELSLADAPPGAQLIQTVDLAGQLVFCPTDAQIAAETLYPLEIQARSAEHTVRKSYVIVLRRVV
jgi:hypothetical protein